MSAERRLTKRTKKEQYNERQNNMKLLSKSISSGEKVMTYITNLKNAQETMACTNVPIEDEYWEINDCVLQEKLKHYLKLWFFPFGGGKLSKTKDEQMKALEKFNLTK